MFEILNSRHVLAVNDLKKSSEYYQHVLCFNLDFSVDGWDFLSLDKFTVMLGECPDEIPVSKLSNHSYFAYANVKDIDSLFRKYKESGAVFTQEVADKPWGLREFGVVTPDGHRIMFGQVI